MILHTDNDLIISQNTFHEKHISSASGIGTPSSGGGANDGVNLLDWLKDKTSKNAYDLKQWIQTNINNGSLVIPGAPVVTKVVATNGSQTTSTASVDIPGLSIPIESGKTYKFEGFIVWTANASGTGIRLNVTCPTNFYWTINIDNGGVADSGTLQCTGSFYNVTTQVLSGGTSTGSAAYISGYIDAQAAGDLKIQYATETATTTTITISNASYLTLTPLS